MKSLCFLFFFALLASLALLRASEPEFVSLNGSWFVRQADKSESIPATVPGCVHTDLLNSQKIPDPFYRDNETQLQWIGQVGWVYQRTFDLTADYLQHASIYLDCEGLDTLARICINGEDAGRSDNMFRVWKFDVKKFLKAGANTIEITFDSTFPYMDQHRTQVAFPDHVVGGHGYVRKEACNYGWDWGPKLVTCGIWRPIELVAWDTARLEDVLITQDHGKSGKVDIGVRVKADSSTRSALWVDVVVSKAGKEVAHGSQVMAENQGKLEINIADPQLWWPWGMGAQNLYEVKTVLRNGEGQVLDRKSRRIGLRTIEWLGKTNERPLRLAVNGHPFFAKGASWIPPEVFPSRATSALLRHYMEDAAAVHMNMIRLWGGGYYEDDALFDRCDELGILLWVDMKFANNAYPTFDAAFVENVKSEIRDNAQRLRDHPSIAVWCGNNEVSYGIGDWAKGRMSQADYDLLFDDVIAKVVEENVPGAIYTPGSPQAGDSYNWGPFENYGSSHGFMSEFGWESYPLPKTVASFTEPADRTSPLSSVMNFHQRKAPPKGTRNANEQIVAKVNQYFREPKDFDSFIWVSQILQAEAIKGGVEHWRRDWPRSTGSIIWQYNDCWPVVSWSMVDYSGRWKAPMYSAQRFFSPYLVSGTVNASKREVTVTVCNDTMTDADGRVNWSLTDLAGKEIDRGTVNVKIPAGPSSVQLANLDLKNQVAKVGKRHALIWLKLDVQGETVSRNLLAFVACKALDLQDPEIAAKVTSAGNGFDVTMEAKRPALFAWLDLQDADARYSDNFVHLAAGEAMTVHLIPSRVMSLEEVQKVLKVRSLFNTYDPNTVSTSRLPISDDAPVMVSSTSNENHGELAADNAVDGDEGTRWSSESRDDQWISTDLGSVREIDEIKLDWESAAGKDYDLEVSDNGKNWNKVQTITGNLATGWLAYPNLHARGRYVRLYGRTRLTTYGFSLWEFQVFGS